LAISPRFSSSRTAAERPGIRFLKPKLINGSEFISRQEELQTFGSVSFGGGFLQLVCVV
jgi:hypothetical protein